MCCKCGNSRYKCFSAHAFECDSLFMPKCFKRNFAICVTRLYLLLLCRVNFDYRDRYLKECEDANVNERCILLVLEGVRKTCAAAQPSMIVAPLSDAPTLHVACSANRSGNSYKNSGCPDPDNANRPWLMCKQGGQSYYLAAHDNVANAMWAAQNKQAPTTCEEAVRSNQFGSYGGRVQGDIVHWLS